MSKFKAKEIATAMTGSEIATSRIAPLLGKNPRTLLELEKLTSKNTFDDVSFSISQGEIIGLTGLLGSGRTELAEAIFGQYPVDSGSIKVDGKEVTPNSPEAALASGIGYVPPDRLTQGLFLEQSILRNIVAVGLDRQRGRWGGVSKSKLAKIGSSWISELRIKTKNPGNPVSSLSGGNQQRVVLAKWLSINPKVMILNGPTVGVDVGSKREILEIIRDRAQAGMAFLLVSDDIPELVQICHKVLVIRHGKISKEFSDKQISESAIYKELN
jgi:simple sugar transport system ATP-binding protein